MRNFSWVARNSLRSRQQTVVRKRAPNTSVSALKTSWHSQSEGVGLSHLVQMSQFQKFKMNCLHLRRLWKNTDRFIAKCTVLINKQMNCCNGLAGGRNSRFSWSWLVIGDRSDWNNESNSLNVTVTHITKRDYSFNCNFPSGSWMI